MSKVHWPKKADTSYFLGNIVRMVYGLLVAVEGILQILTLGFLIFSGTISLPFLEWSIRYKHSKGFNKYGKN